MDRRERLLSSGAILSPIGNRAVTRPVGDVTGMIQCSMRLLPLTEQTADAVIREGIRLLRAGGIIAYATESYYALGVQATDEEAVRRLYTIKRRPREKPLPVIVGAIETLESIVKTVPLQARSLIEAYWPGPLTIVFEAKDHLPLLLTGGASRVAARIPGESAALQLAKTGTFAITATSANPSSQPPAKHPDEIIRYFSKGIDLIIDAGASPGGLPSTIVDATTVPFAVLRQGSVRLECEPEKR